MSVRHGLTASTVAIVGMIAVSVWTRVELGPRNEVPLHFDLEGNPDRWGTAWQGLLPMPLVALAMTGLFVLLPRIEPRARHLLESSRAYRATWLLSMLVFLGLHTAMALTMLGHEIDVGAVVFGLLGVMFLGIGNYLGKIRRNVSFGVRTPWTLASELSWNKTQRMSGRLVMGYGAALLAAGLFGGIRAGLAVFLVGMVAVLAVSLAYSYAVWKTDPRRDRREF